jgi:hypothetical protein
MMVEDNLKDTNKIERKLTNLTRKNENEKSIK